MTISTLNESRQVVLDASGGGRVTFGPGDNAGPRTWAVDGIIVQTNRPGLAPIPRASVFLDSENPSGVQGITYDGSFNNGGANIRLSSGSRLICVWAGGLAGDIASITVTGTKY